MKESCSPCPGALGEKSRERAARVGRGAPAHSGFRPQLDLCGPRLQGTKLLFLAEGFSIVALEKINHISSISQSKELFSTGQLSFFHIYTIKAFKFLVFSVYNFTDIFYFFHFVQYDIK